MRKVFLLSVTVFTLLIASGLYFKFPLIPLLLFATLIACILSFVVYGLIGRDTQKKQEELLEKERRFFKGTNKNNG